MALPFIDAQAQIATSSQEMKEVVWPVIKEPLGGGTLITQEGERGHLSQILDSEAGIDHFQHNKALGLVRGLATRVQHFPYCFRSFTIRLKTVGGGVTEHEKLLRRIQENGLRSDVTIQAYVRQQPNVLVGALWMETDHLCHYLLDLERSGRHPEIRRGADGNYFYVIWLEDLEQSGYLVHGYNVCELTRPGHPDLTTVGFYP